MEQDQQMIQFLKDIDLPYIVIATKVDKMKPHERELALKTLRDSHQLRDCEPLPFSSITGEGR